MKLWMVFVLGAMLCWGAYVPTIHHGQAGFGGKSSALRAFLFVGVAYCIIAVCIPLGLLAMKVEPADMTRAGVTISCLAGTLGALGALCVIFALKSGGKPVYVAPLVFAGAPIVSTLVSMIWHPPKQTPSMLFFAGILMAAAGASLVLRFKPS